MRGQAGANFRHGACIDKERSPAYVSFCLAQNRCTNPKNNRYYRYGARGIEFRFTSFEQFFSEVGPRPKGHTIERIDNNGHYEPGNVRWLHRSLQSKNREYVKAARGLA